MQKIPIIWSVFKKMDKVPFELHVKYRLYWINMDQKEIFLITFSITPTIPKFIDICLDCFGDKTCSHMARMNSQ
jgi:hypothetical protein